MQTRLQKKTCSILLRRPRACEEAWKIEYATKKNRNDHALFMEGGLFVSMELPWNFDFDKGEKLESFDFESLIALIPDPKQRGYCHQASFLKTRGLSLGPCTTL